MSRATGRDRPAHLAGPDAPREAEMDEALRALAEPRRRAIMELVAHSELSAGEIAGCFDVTRTAVSQHLTILKHAGLLTERRMATRRLYRARPEGLAGLRDLPRGRPRPGGSRSRGGRCRPGPGGGLTGRR